MKKSTLIEIGVVAVLAYGGYYVVHKMSAASAATAATNNKTSNGTQSNNQALTNAGIAAGGTFVGDLSNWLFGAGSNTSQTNSGSGTPVNDAAQPNASGNTTGTTGNAGPVSTAVGWLQSMGM